MAKKSLNLRGRILNAHDLKTSIVKITEWSEDEFQPLEITVQELSAKDRNTALALHGEKDTLHAVCKTVELGVLDEDGSLAFEEGDAAELAKKSDSAITKLYKEIMKLSGVELVAPADVDSDKEAESIAGKPLETTPSSGETIGSCSNSESKPIEN
mgnify:CR=1 FL=1|tara:strand:- start:9329 stop:9796 length:468 start_codon:yes stop_codon:yes gene_type:complete